MGHYNSLSKPPPVLPTSRLPTSSPTQPHATCSRPTVPPLPTPHAPHHAHSPLPTRHAPQSPKTHKSQQKYVRSNSPHILHRRLRHRLITEPTPTPFSPRLDGWRSCGCGALHVAVGVERHCRGVVRVLLCSVVVVVSMRRKCGAQGDGRATRRVVLYWL